MQHLFPSYGSGKASKKHLSGEKRKKQVPDIEKEETKAEFKKLSNCLLLCTASVTLSINKSRI